MHCRQTTNSRARKTRQNLDFAGKRRTLFQHRFASETRNAIFAAFDFMCAIAVFETLQETYKIQPDIKWANDVHVNDKKICGILAETSETNKGLAVIVGIGINLNSSNFPPELNEIATSIESETNQNPNAVELLENLTKQLSKFYDNNSKRKRNRKNS